MATYGLTTDGLVIKTLGIIRDELIQRFRDKFGASLKLDDETIFGQILGIVSEVAALIWEQLEVVNSSQDPNKASGAALDALCLLTGTIRPPASYSAVVLTLTGTPTAVIPSLSKVKTESTAVTFETENDVTLEAADPWIGSIVYTVGERVTNGNKIYQCTKEGLSAAIGGPATEEYAIADGGAEWMYIGPGTGVVDVIASALETGPVVAVARDLTVIATPVAGWDSAVNLTDATLGRNVASDEELRMLREAELAGAGNTPIDAIRADLLNVPGVVAVTIFVNNTDTTNADGMPPHSVEALVRGTDPLPDGFEQSIWDALLANVAAGILTHGLIEGTATDTQGTSHTMRFNYPEETAVYATLDVVVDASAFPTNGATLIKEAITTWGDSQLTGKDVVASALVAQAFKVKGVLDVPSVKIGLSPGPSSSASIPISLRQLATYDSSRIIVNVTTGVP